MKKNKRWLSLLLSLTLVAGSCAVAFTAMASPSDVARVEEKLKTVTSVDTLTQAIVNDYNTLTEAEKDSIDAYTLAQVYRFAGIKYGGKEGIEQNLGFTRAMKDAAELGAYFYNRVSGCKPVSYTYNGQSKSVTVGDNLNYINFSSNVGGYGSMKGYTPAEQKAVYEALRGLWLAASPRAREYADVMMFETTTFTYFGASNGRKYGSCPSVSMLSLEAKYYAATTPGFTSAARQEHLTNFGYGETMNLVLKNLASLSTLLEELLKNKTITYDAFREAAYPLYEELPDSSNVPFYAYESIFTYRMYYSSFNSEERQGSLSKYRDAIRSIMTELNTFDEKIKPLEAMEIPAAPSQEFNSRLNALRVSIDQTTIEKLSKLTPALLEKYQKIQAMYLYDKDKVGPSHTDEAFESVKVDYQMARPYGDILQNTLVPAVDTIVGQVLPGLTNDGKGLQGIVEKALFTNNNATEVLKFASTNLYYMLAKLLLGEEALEQAGINDPAAVALVPALVDNYGKYYNSVVRPLNDLVTLPDGSLNPKITWADLPENFLDWGITPGDYEAFRDAVCFCFGQMYIAYLGVFMPDQISYNSTTGEPTINDYGLYAKLIIPLEEALGVPADKIMSSFGYSASSSGDFTAAMSPIIDQLYYNVIIPLLESPVSYLTENLPNLIYHLKDGCIFDGIKEVVAMFAGQGIIPDETIEMLNNMLTYDGIMDLLLPMLQGLGINISKEDISVFAQLGTLEEVETASPLHETTLRVKADKESVVRQLAKIVEPIALGLLDSELGFSFEPGKAFVKAEAPQYPHDGKMGKDVMLAMIKGLDGLLGGFINLNEVINNALCTPVMAADAITGIYTALGNLDLSGAGITLPVSPKDVANMLTEDKYKEIRAALQVEAWNDVALVVKNGNAVFDIIDMGFKAGDRQGFVDCLAASLRPLVKLLVDAGLMINDEAAGSYGLYETLIIPIFEALGVKPAADSANFTDNFNKLILRADKGAAYDYLVKTVLSPVLDLLNRLATSPADTLMGLLPNLAYAVRYNEDLAFIGNLLADEEGNIDLAGMLNGLIGGLLPGFELPAIPLDALASCGEVKTMKSMSQLHESYTNVVPDKADAFVTVFYYLYDAINYKDNLKAINTLISGIEGLDPSLQPIIGTLLNDVFTAGKEEALCQLGSLLASDVWACPDTADEDGVTGKTTPATGDSEVAAVAVLPLFFAAGLAIFLLRSKKKAVLR